ncbi:MAG: hypothetical protein WDW38_001915 [Sanguina aurantia]
MAASGLCRAAVLLLLACSGSLAQTNAPTSLGSLLGWQQHGWDDLREWRVSMLKGSWIFKLDFNYQPEEYCSRQKHVPQPADPRGCMLLIHTPTEFSVGKNGPHSSTSLLQWLATPSNAPLITAPARRKYIALRFYSFPATPCDGSPNSNNWLSLADDFYAASNPLSICFHTSFRVFDNNVTNYDNRYQVFNRGELLPQLRDMANNTWYKFGASEYPLVVYEPSDEAAVNIIQDIFLGSNFNHTPGYVTAFNNDPVMHTLYSASRSHKAIHAAITADQGFNISTTVSLRNLALRFAWPQVATLDVSAAGDGSSFVVVTVYRDNAQNAKYITHRGSGPVPDAFINAPPPAIVFSNYTQLTQAALPTPTAARISSISAFTLMGVSYVLVGDDAGGGQLLTLDTIGGALTPFSAFKLPAPAQALYAGNALHAIVVPNAAPNMVSMVQATTGSTHALGPVCTVWSQLYNMNMTAAPVVPVAFGLPICVSSWSGATKIKVITGTAVHVSVGVAVALPSSRCSMSPVYGETFALETYVAYSNRFGFNQVGMGSEVFLAQVCMDLQFGGASNTVQPTPAIRPPVFTVGDFPSVAALTVPATNTTTVMMVSTNGFCPNSFLRDDTPTGYPQMCDAYSRGYGTPQVGVMTYVHTSGLEMSRRLIKGNGRKGVLTNVCDDKMLHGNYDQGYQPTISIINTPLGVVANEVHAGLASLAQNDCGSPVPVDGLVLDAWLLATPAVYKSKTAYKRIAALISDAATNPMI